MPTVTQSRPKARRDAGQRHREASARNEAKNRTAARDIKNHETERPKFGSINWDRRLAGKADLKTALKTYLPEVFFLDWSRDHLRIIEKAEQLFREQGRFSLAMPRGNGKTALCRGAILIMACLYGFKSFPFFIGSSAQAAKKAMHFLKTQLYGSPTILEDFPEIAAPVRCIENQNRRAMGQLYRGHLTHIQWADDTIRLPCLRLNKRSANLYLKHDPESLIYVEHLREYVPKTAGILVRAAGIDGSIRGEADTHPILLNVPRPDIVVADDVQKDQVGASPDQVRQLEALFDAAITNLSGPKVSLSVLMPGTIMREGCFASLYTNPEKKPRYDGERIALVTSWPEGITNHEITRDTPAGLHWNKYAEKLRKPGREGLAAATAYYQKHRKLMDAGFTVAWPDRFDEGCISAQQSAMNKRLDDPQGFLCEFQQVGRSLANTGEIAITAADLARKTTNYQVGQIPADTHCLGAMLDLQNEIFFYTTVAVNIRFGGIIAERGTWPPVETTQFTKAQTEAWSLLTAAYFQRYPEQRGQAFKNSAGRLRAPLQEKITFALSQAVPWLLSKVYRRQDKQGTPMKIGKLAIDARWGETSETVTSYCRECGLPEVLRYLGQDYPPSRKQLEEYTPTPGWLFEHQAHPTLQEAKWLIKPIETGQLSMSSDVDRAKDFVMARFATPPGGNGSISLHRGTEDEWQLYARHVCESEYPEPVTKNGRTKNKWTERDGKPDNDWLDTTAGAMQMCSVLGACLHADRPSGRRPKKTNKQKYEEKRAQRGQG